MVSIVIPTLSAKTKEYLDLCLESIRNLDYPQERIDVVISSPVGYAPAYEGVLTVHHEKPNRDFAEAVNFGVERTNKDSQHIFLISDDVVLTKDSLSNMVRWIGDDDVIMNGISNCDNYWKYMLALSIGERPVLDRYLRLEQVADITKEMMNAESKYSPGLLIADTLCFYATLVPRKVWNALGPLDEQFKTGYEDSDYCARARKQGITMTICLDALIWHFGGVTTEGYLTEEMKDRNSKLFVEKWSSV